MRDINEVAKKMARNGLEIAKSSGCAFHFESEFSLDLHLESYCCYVTLSVQDVASVQCSVLILVTILKALHTTAPSDCMRDCSRQNTGVVFSCV